MDRSQDFKSLQEKVQTALVAATRTTNQLAAEDLSFQKTSNPAVEDRLDETSGHLLELASSLIKSAAKGTDLKASQLEDADDIDVHWSRIVDVVDTLLEKADTCLDEYTGLIKRKGAPTEETGPLPKKSKSHLEHNIRRANILKPQERFEVKPDNFDTSPWKPILTKKPHALVPLKESLEPFTDENQATQYDYSTFLPFSLLQGPLERRVLSNPEEQTKHEKFLRKKRSKKLRDLQDRSSDLGADGRIRYKHPYETEILNLKYPEHAFEIREPIKYQPIESTTATYVDTYEGVLEMLEELKKATEIAIDTEHHDFRTYSGLLSLMQISTREKDWIVDTLQPWRHKLEVLNEVFADPKIIKVLQGAYMDIVWLQRDCGLYIVGLFDTYEAAVSLGYPGRGLAYLLKRFVDFDADKKYQLADWRIRPIPEEMFYYARSDTHYLLYIYDMIRNELLENSDRSNPEQDLIGQVLDRSKDTSLRRHERIVYDTEGGHGPFGWLNLLMRNSSGTFTKEQFAVFRAVHKWRDDLARRQDEDPLFIMPNATLFDIARRLPPDPKALHATFGHNTSYVAKREVADLFKVITKAKAESVNGPSVVDVFRRTSTTSSMAIGAVAQTVFPQLKNGQSENEDVSETGELVSSKSQLWGKVALSSRWDEGSAGVNKAAQSLQFSLPWAHMLEDATIGTEQLPSAPETSTTDATGRLDAASGVQPNEDDKVDSEFTLKTGLKRKAPQSDSEDEDDEEGEEESGKSHRNNETLGAENEDEIEVDVDSEEDKAAQKKARKAERQARKKAKSEAKKAEKEAKRAAKKAAKQAATQGGSEGGEDSEEDYQPFDYTQAQSVFNTRRGANGGKGGAETSSKNARFNPYANAMMADGPKPARRMHGEKAGKSATFKR